MRIALGLIALTAVAAVAPFLTTADVRYRFAERLYQMEQFEAASFLCDKALSRNPNHAPARALRTEVEFILGRGHASSYRGEFDVFMHNHSYIPTAQLLSEIDHALARGERHDGAGEREAGLVEVRKALEFMKWMPEGQDLNARRDRAESLKILLATGGSTDD
jgi:hypothetical protein